MGRLDLYKTVKTLVYAKIGIASLALTFYAGAKNNTAVERLEDSFFYKNIPVAEQSFPDPAGLEILTEINSEGKKEVYIYHPESGRKVSIGRDMLPGKTEVLAEALEHRLYCKSFK